MLNILSVIILLYVVVGIALFAFQRSFIYFPVAAAAATKLAPVAVDVNGLRLQGLIANSGQETAVFYFGGNAEQIAHSIAELAEQLTTVTVVGFYYRGYGGSQGEPSERALFADALALYDKLAGQYQRVVVMGRSLGSGVAVYLAQQRKVDHLVLVTPFDSVMNIARDIYWYYPIRWMLRDKFNSVKLAPQLTCPVLVLIAGEDTTVPNKYTENLLRHLPQGLWQSRLFPGAGHNNIETAEGYYSAIGEFILQPSA